MRYDDRIASHGGHRTLLRWSAAALVLLLLLTGTAAFAAGDYVYDTVKLFRSDEAAQLRLWADAIDRSTGIEVVVATADLGNQSIEKVAVDLFEQYKIGKAGQDNGLLILIAPKQKQYRFEVGYGLEGMLPDSLVGSWGQKYLAPSFRENNYFEGISVAYQQGLLPAIEKETGKKVTLQGARTPSDSLNHQNEYQLTPTQVGLGGAVGIILLIVVSVILGRITGDPFIILRILFLILRSGGGGGGRGGGGWGGGGGGGGRSGGGRSGGGGASGGW